MYIFFVSITVQDVFLFSYPILGMSSIFLISLQQSNSVFLTEEQPAASRWWFETQGNGFYSRKIDIQIIDENLWLRK